MKHTYRPLPNFLTIKNSSIEGLGLFSKDYIGKDKIIGISHLVDDRFPNNLCRTPIGGFINHSDTPNIRMVDAKFNRNGEIVFNGEPNCYVFITNNEILDGEELSVNYRLTPCCNIQNNVCFDDSSSIKWESDHT